MSGIVVIQNGSKFYHFGQNNSGGRFVLDETSGITHHVIIEAYSADDANKRAETIGLYFGGTDCDCCGDRWYPQWGPDSGTSTPEVYSEPANFYTGMAWMDPGKEIVIHYLDGNREWHGVYMAPKKIK